RIILRLGAPAAEPARAVERRVAERCTDVRSGQRASLKHQRLRPRDRGRRLRDRRVLVDGALNGRVKLDLRYVLGGGRPRAEKNGRRGCYKAQGTRQKRHIVPSAFCLESLSAATHVTPPERVSVSQVRLTG